MLSYRRVLPRLVAELRDALDTCAERQRQLEQSLRVSRRLLRAWYAGPGTPDSAFPGPSEPLSETGPGGRAQCPLTRCLLSVSSPSPLSLKAGVLLPVSSQGTS